MRLLYFHGCPDRQETERRLPAAIAAAGVDAAVRRTDVPTVEDAERWGFRGSPTVLVDGADPFADESAPVGLSCRRPTSGTRRPTASAGRRPWSSWCRC